MNCPFIIVPFYDSLHVAYILFFLFLLESYPVRYRLSPMHTGLRNTGGSMRGCARKKRTRRLNVRDNIDGLKLRWLFFTLILLSYPFSCLLCECD